MKTSLKAILGFLVAPISPGLLALIIAAPFRIGEVGFGLREMSEAMWIIGLSVLLGYPVAIVFGVPCCVFFRSRGWNGLRVYVVAGVILGLIVYFLYVLLAGHLSNGIWELVKKFSDSALIQIPVVTICGAVATSFFWLIVRPDRIGSGVR